MRAVRDAPFITARMENIGRYHEQLVPLVGEHEAARLLCETFSRAVRQ